MSKIKETEKILKKIKDQTMQNLVLAKEIFVENDLGEDDSNKLTKLSELSKNISSELNNFIENFPESLKDKECINMNLVWSGDMYGDRGNDGLKQLYNSLKKKYKKMEEILSNYN